MSFYKRLQCVSSYYWRVGTDHCYKTVRKEVVAWNDTAT